MLVGFRNTTDVKMENRLCSSVLPKYKQGSHVLSSQLHSCVRANGNTHVSTATHVSHTTEKAIRPALTTAISVRGHMDLSLFQEAQGRGTLWSNASWGTHSR